MSAYRIDSENEKQYLQNFTALQKSLIVKNLIVSLITIGIGFSSKASKLVSFEFENLDRRPCKYVVHEQRHFTYLTAFDFHEVRNFVEVRQACTA